MKIYNPDGTVFVEAALTKAAQHEEELMKSDFVLMSWSDAERYVIPAGAYIIPYPDDVDLDGEPVRYQLFRQYVPEQIRHGEYSFKPEFQHPKMRLAYIPFLFDTKDATGADVRKSEYEYIGPLGTLVNYLCSYVNKSLGQDSEGLRFTARDPQHPSQDIALVLTDTVKVTFSEDSVMSAIQKVANEAGCEYHLDWPQRLFWFGSIYLGSSDYELKVGENIGVPKVSESKEKTYNRFFVQGGTRNVVRTTEHGNIPLNTRLLLNPTKYPDSIIDTRENASDPELTGYLTLDGVYPHLELYLYDLHERHKYKLDSDGNVTDEEWSVWYFKLAYYNSDSNNNIGTCVKDGVTYYWHEFRLYDNGKAKVLDKDTALKEVTVDLPFTDIYRLTKVGDKSQYNIRIDIDNTDYTVGIEGKDNGTQLVQYIGDSDDTIFSNFMTRVAKGEVLFIGDGVDLGGLPYKNVTTSAIDGLAPSVAFMVNESSGAMISSLGTREFELIYNTKAVSFNLRDDVAGQTGIDAGYYEIVHTTEGSDELIVPTTSLDGAGLIPRGNSTPSLQANMVSLFNVSIGDEYKQLAQDELEAKAKEEIVRLLADTNHYSFPANPVVFEEEEPWLYLGRRIAFDDAAGYRISTRILSITTKLDYAFEKEVTVGNKLPKKFSDEVLAQIEKLRNGGGGWNEVAITTPATTTQVVEYPEWIEGQPYYFETLNRTTGIIETSNAWRRGCLWGCRRTLTQDEPWFTSSDWECLRATNLALNFFDTNVEDPQPITVVQIYPKSVDFTVVPYLLIGNEDITEGNVTAWKWTRQSENTAQDENWNSAAKTSQRSMRITKADLPTGYKRGDRLTFTCTATLAFDYGGSETIINRVNF